MSYSPRLTDDGMRDSPYWYSMNPFYIYGYGLPNCTCYAWGRFFENSDTNHEYDPSRQPTLSLGNARAMVGIYSGWLFEGAISRTRGGHMFF